MNKNNMLILKEILRSLPKRSYFSFLINTVTKSITIVFFPIFIQMIVNRILNGNANHIISITAIYFLIMLLIEVVHIQNNKRCYTLFNDVRRSYMSRVHEGFMNMEYRNFENDAELQKAYAAYEATLSNEDGIEGVYHSLFELGWKVLSFILLSIYLTTINMGIVIALLVSSLLLLYISFKEKQIDIAHLNDVYESKRKLVYFTYDSSDISYGKEKRIYQFSANIKRMFECVLTEYASILSDVEKKKKILHIISETLTIITYIMLFVLLYSSYQQGLAIEKIIAVLTIVFSYANILNEMVNDVSMIARELKKANDTLDFIDINTIDSSNKEKAPHIIEIVFQNVNFRYQEHDRYVIKDCSFKIKKGESIALLGLNGAGKTTITKLLIGLYKPTSGKVLINGIELEKLDSATYFDLLSYVEQENNTMSMKISEFIVGGNKIDLDQIENCLKEVGLYTKISSFDEGIHTTMTKYLDSKGVEFSGGELQKLYIARSLYRCKAELYIFDEPTASLDYISEKEVYDAFNKISKNHISLFISHKLSTTNFCNRILVLKDGSIIEDGTRDELLEKNGHYYEMVNAEQKAGMLS